MRHIHFIAIGGSIMHSLAISMKINGYEVTGSDDEIYEPSRTRLNDAGILPSNVGWDPSKIHENLDCVVLGMHARQDNPELKRAIELGIKVFSFPEFVFQLSKEKIRIMVAGSHGKTTTSGMIAHVLDKSGKEHDRMVGAAIGNLAPVKISNAPVIVLEGDEYLTSPVDLRPKFLHYFPQFTVITGLEWDHMNVFPTWDLYVKQFRDLLMQMTEEDEIIYCGDDPELVTLIQDVTIKARATPYYTHPYHVEDGVVLLETDQGEIPLKIFGKHNLQNLSAAKWACLKAGVTEREFYNAISTFTGVQSRLQEINVAPRKGYKDFAHAPSKVRATVKAVREKHQDSFIVGILELHTFSSLNPAFLPNYKDTMSGLDIKVVYFSPHTLTMKKLPLLEVKQVQDYFNDRSIKVITDVSEIQPYLASKNIQNDSVFLWMSSGRFDGLDIESITKDC